MGPRLLCYCLDLQALREKVFQMGPDALQTVGLELVLPDPLAPIASRPLNGAYLCVPGAPSGVLAPSSKARSS